MELNFAMTGAAGYIAPRHLQAIKETGNSLIAALDPSDSIGILDRYFHDVSYFKEFERFDRHIEKLRFQNDPDKIDFLTVCSPNFLHDAHIRFGLKTGASVICEKPIVINPWNIDLLSELENQSQGKIYTVLQLRHHPSIVALKNKINKAPKDEIFDVDLNYITSRGPWYHYAWKGDTEKSGGLATNIGVHFFDMLTWIFGQMISCEVHHSDTNLIAGYLVLEKARVKWLLSIDRKFLPKEVALKGQSTFRSMKVNDEELEFSHGFTDLHTVVYKSILSGNGFSIRDAKPSIDIVHKIRNLSPLGINENTHSYLVKLNNN